MKNFSMVAAWVLVLLASPVLAQQNSGRVNPTSDLGVEFYSQGGVVVDGIAYFTSDDGDYVKTGLRSPAFTSVVAFDVNTLRTVRTYPVAQTYDSAPFLLQKKDGKWLVIAHEYKNKRTVVCCRDTGQVAWISAANQPGILAHGRVLSGDLGEDRVVVTQIAENSKGNWPGPFGDPQTNPFALPDEPGVRLVPLKAVRPESPQSQPSAALP